MSARLGSFVSLESGNGNLEKIDTIVVVMLENRSFDHMLGYLSLERGRRDIDGLRAEFENEHAGRRYPVHHLESTRVREDPDHSADAVDVQIGTKRSGPSPGGRRRASGSMSRSSCSRSSRRRSPRLATCSSP